MERPERPRSLVGKLLGLLAVCAVVASVIATLAATNRLGGPSAGAGGSATSLIGSPRIISTLTAAHMLCPTSAAFSSDGSRLAVIGTSAACYGTQSSTTLDESHELAIFDGHSATLLRIVQLDPLVDRSYGSVDNQVSVLPGVAHLDPLADRMPLSTPNEERIRAIRYVGLGWAPDGKRIAVAYTAFDSASELTFSHVVDFGLLLIAADTGAAQPIRPYDAGFLGTSPVYPVWNLAKNVSMLPLAPQPGLTYNWSADGRLEPLPALGSTPLNQLPVSAGARYPVGNPDGDSTFTIWQPGILMGSGTAQLGNGRDAFVTAFPTWSSSGTYVTMMVGGVAVPGPGTANTNATAPVGPPAYPMPAMLPGVPARDAAMTAVIAQVGASGWALVAWSPNGNYLASINCQDAAGPTLEIRDTGTGSLVGSAPVPLGPVDAGCSDLGGGEDLGDYPNPSLWMQWSPEGSQVLVTDQRSGNLLLWSVRPPVLLGA